MKKNGYVLLETIVVVSILGVILVTVFYSFNNILKSTEKRNYYDNTEYLYKTYMARKYIKANFGNINHVRGDVNILCSNTLSGYPNCSGYPVFQEMHIEGIYVSDYAPVLNNNTKKLEATTQLYIKHLDPEVNAKTANLNRLIIMYTDENYYVQNYNVCYNTRWPDFEGDCAIIYEYASLKWSNDEEY